MVQRAPVSENKQSKQITRLQNQLKDAKRDLRQNVAKKREDHCRPEETDHIEDALKVAGSFQEERRSLVSENQRLQSRVDGLEKVSKDETCDRAKFLEGASYMARKALGENETTNMRVNQLLDDFHEKKRRAEMSGDGLFAQANSEWLTDQVKSSLSNSKKNLQGMLQSSVYNQENANRNIGTYSKIY